MMQAQTAMEVMAKQPQAQAGKGDGQLWRTWPISAQVSLAFLLGVSATLVGTHALSLTRWGTRPTEFEQRSGPLYLIDLNQAEVAELMQLPGMGPASAGRVIHWRQEHGKFDSIDELNNIPGIKSAVVNRWRPWLTVGDKAHETRRQSPDPDRGPVPLSNADSRKSAGRSSPGRKPLPAERSISLNQASESELQKLPGIGPVMAQRIVEERRKRPFNSIDDLRRVRGVGPKTLERLRPYVNAELVPESPLVHKD